MISHHIHAYPHTSLDESTAGQRASLSTFQRIEEVVYSEVMCQAFISVPCMFFGSSRSGSFPLYTGELAKVVIEQHSSE